ncbi:MAG: hypothetical protein Q9222_005484 [Ikaeria aurantiellina]
MTEPEDHPNRSSAFPPPALLSSPAMQMDSIEISTLSSEPARGQTAVALAYLEPPNGGLKAWLQILGSFLIFFNTWWLHLPLFKSPSLIIIRGTINTFGAFQTYYSTDILRHISPSDISWIGSIQAFLVQFVGALTGPLYDAGYFRALVITGSLLVVFGTLMISLCTHYWHFLLAQAFCVGLGAGLLYIPSVALLPQYFSTKRSLVTGIAASGSSLGGVIYPILLRQLEPRVGFGWATRVMGVLAFVTLLVPVLIMRDRGIPKRRRKLIDSTAFRDAPYLLFSMAMFFADTGFFGPIYYIQSFAIDALAIPSSFSFYLVSIINAASVPGRIVPGWIAKKSGPVNMLMPASFISGILCFSWIGIHSASGLIVFAILYGFFSGGVVSLPAAALTTLSPDLNRLGTRMGMERVVASLGSLAGPPIAGAILASSHSYRGVQLFCGLTVFCAGGLLLATRVVKEGYKPMVKI